MGMSQPAPPQYSRDGRWWWDGSRWSEVTPDWPPRLAGAAAAPPQVAVEERATGLRLPHVPLHLVVALGAVMAVLVAGAGIAWVVQHRPLPPPVVASPPPALSATPTPASSPPAERFPYRYMSGLTVSEVTRQLQAQGFACGSPQQERDLGLAVWRCQRQTGTTSAVVTILAHDEARVHMIDAEVLGAGQNPALDDVRSLFDSLAGLPLKQQPDLATQARDWVKANADRDGYTLFGQIGYSTLAVDQSFFLEMDAGFVR
jgi:hypothetical protein